MHIVCLRCGPFSLINELKITLHYRIKQSHILKGPNKATYYFLVGARNVSYVFIRFQEDFIPETKHVEFWEKDSKPYLVSRSLNIVFAGAISCHFSVTKKACPCSLYYLNSLQYIRSTVDVCETTLKKVLPLQLSCSDR